MFIYLPQFATGQIARVPTLEVTVPLHRRNTEKLAGAAQFIVEGQSIADEYARLDQRLIQIAVITFAVAGTVLVAMLWPAFRRVEKLNRDLAVRGERLQRANEELALAARASAVGAISAHLMHGLKNPLASLSQFVSRRGNGNAGSANEDWQDALTASRRMQSLVEQTLEVLGDARGEPTYELSVKELEADVQKRVAAAAARRQVKLDSPSGRQLHAVQPHRQPRQPGAGESAGECHRGDATRRNGFSCPWRGKGSGCAFACGTKGRVFRNNCANIFSCPANPHAKVAAASGWPSPNKLPTTSARTWNWQNHHPKAACSCWNFRCRPANR